MKKTLFLSVLVFLSACAGIPKEGTWQAKAYKEKEAILALYKDLPYSAGPHEFDPAFNHTFLPVIESMWAEDFVKPFSKELNAAYRKSKTYQQWQTAANANIEKALMSFMVTKGLAVLNISFPTDNLKDYQTRMMLKNSDDYNALKNDFETQKNIMATEDFLRHCKNIVGTTFEMDKILFYDYYNGPKNGPLYPEF